MTGLNVTPGAHFSVTHVEAAAAAVDAAELPTAPVAVAAVATLGVVTSNGDEAAVGSLSTNAKIGAAPAVTDATKLSVLTGSRGLEQSPHLNGQALE